MKRLAILAALGAVLLTSCAASAPGLRGYAPPFDNSATCDQAPALEPARAAVIMRAYWIGPLPSLAIAWTDTVRGFQGDTLRTQPRAGVVKGMYRPRVVLVDLAGNVSCAESLLVAVLSRPARITDLRAVSP